MACETDGRLFKSIKVQSFKMVKPCPQTPSLQDHALEPGPRLAAMSGLCLCPGTGSRSARTAPPSPAQAPVWSEAGAIPNITDPWGPFPDIDRIDEAGSFPSSLVQYPICCIVSICISRSQALCTVHISSVPNINVNSFLNQGTVNILKCSAILLLIMCAAKSAGAGVNRHPLSVKALTRLSSPVSC